MRCQIQIAIAVVCGFVVFTLAAGEAPMQSGGVANTTKDHPNVLTLLHNASVKNHLKLTTAQLQKVDDGLWEMLKGVLSTEQYNRLVQIDLEFRGYRAFTDPKVQDKLHLDGEQKAAIATLLADCDNGIDALLQSIKTGVKEAGAAAGAGEKIKAIEFETKTRCAEILTDEQQRIWLEMLGDPWPRPGFGVLPDINGNLFERYPTKKGAAKKKGS